MRYSKLLIPTVKEVPAEAEVPSHQLMIRAGLIRKVASGTYTYLPLGWKCLLKIIAIVREEMNATGAQEISVPILQPIELWQATGRDVDYGENLCQFRDRHGRVNALAPTAEEVVTALVAGEISSYKQLPVNLYQINEKFRDEFRPRFGVLRSREFIMKDAYSFHATAGSLEETYRAMYDAYCRIFSRCGLRYVVVEAESGPIGGSASHEFMVPCAAGEDVIVHTEDFSYAANIEKAKVDATAREQGSGTGDQGPGNGGQGPGTRDQGSGNRDQGPGIRDQGSGNRDQATVPRMEEVHTPGVGSIEAVCALLKTQPRDMIKTLVFWEPDEKLLARYDAATKNVVQHMEDFFALNEAIWSKYGPWSSQEEYAEDLRKAMEADPKCGPRVDAYVDAAMEHYALAAAIGRCATVALVRGDHDANAGKLNGAAGAALVMAPESVIRAVTRAAVGFAGPVGLDRVVARMVIDHAVAAMPAGVTGANKTDYHLKNVVPGRDFPLPESGTAANDAAVAPPPDAHTGRLPVAANVIVADIRNAVEGDTHDGKPLKFSRGIEVGHVFKLGTKYSEKLGARFLDEKGVAQPCIMGCYGIGINRILASAIEMGSGHDDAGCILPIAIAPFEVEVVPLNNDKADVMREAQRIYDELKAAGADALLDDRDVRPGVKFKDSDLLGIPLRVVVGERGLKEGKVEIKRRTDAKATLVQAAQSAGAALELLREMRHMMKVRGER